MFVDGASSQGLKQRGWTQPPSHRPSPIDQLGAENAWNYYDSVRTWDINHRTLHEPNLVSQQCLWAFNFFRLRPVAIAPGVKRMEPAVVGLPLTLVGR